MSYTRRTVKHTDRRRIIFLSLLAAAVFMLVVILALEVTASDASADEQPVPMTYQSIQIKSGDTIWSIAETWKTDEWKDTRAYVKEIKEINNLTSDTIHAGNYLVIPYYDHDLSHIVSDD